MAQHDGPDVYIQSAQDRKDEVQDAFDAMMGVIGGQAPDTYHVGVYDPETGEYWEDEADTLAEAHGAATDHIEAADLPYDLPDDRDTLLIEERDWV